MCAACSGVPATNPGATTLTVIRRGPSSRASARLNPSSAAFAVVYATMPVPPPLRAAWAPIVMIRPPSGITASAARLA